MIPSVVARQLGDALIDYVVATLDLDDPGFVSRFERFLRGPDGLLRGPYLRLGLPFATASSAADIPLEIRPPFQPYAHQVQAFAQLSAGPGRTPRNTLVTTGTGSGKTECFLYPILDHCWRHRHEPGIKAILLYPMNALATDQARRLAELVAAHTPGLRAGLYVGGEGQHAAMGPDHLIEDKQRLRAEPPDILLTNYKMLDFMLLRPDERELWSHNGPETLRYLVVDELHTFDGAQGSDVAALLRRLRARLRIPEGRLVCAGTSATIGSATDPSTFRRLAEFAATIFGEPFDPAHVVREQRVPRQDFLTAPVPGALLPTLDDEARQLLDPERHRTPTGWLDAQQRLWLGERPPDPVALGDRLRAHPLLHHLVAIVDRPRDLQDIDGALERRLEGWGTVAPSDRARLLDSFLALVSHARRRQGAVEMPLLTVQLQLWGRELRRLLRRLPDPREAEPVAFAWYTDLPGANPPQGAHAPQARCTECGLVGLAAAQTDQDRERGVLSFAPAAVGEAWLRSHRHARFVWPRPLAEADRPGELVHWLDAETCALSGTPGRDADGRQRAWPVVLEGETRETKRGPRFAARCPRCGEHDALSMVGARAASLTSVVVTHLYQTPFHGADPKLLAFTDSVQDACHRAGFFGARTYRIHLRTAIQAVVQEAGTLRLSEAAERFERHWRGELGDVGYVAAFLPPDLRELPEAQRFSDSGGKGKHPKLWRILRDRIGWEITRELGLAAAIGRSLERSAASTLTVDLERFDAASERFARWLEEEGLLVGDSHPGHLLTGLVHRMRHMGAIHHPFLRAYIAADGNSFLLSKGKNPYISPAGPKTKRVRFLSSKTRSRTFPCPFGPKAARGWYGDWLRRTLDWDRPTASDLQRVYGRALDLLVEHRIVEARGAQGHTTWGLRPDALVLTTELGALRHGTSGRVTHVARELAERCDGLPSWAFRSADRLRAEEPQPGFYARLYGSGHTRRVYPGEHTGLLDRDSRTALEDRFKAGATAEAPQAENLLVCTPTLEMGVDIGDLSATLLCSVPPTPANYLQRVGRAGRKTGNALIFVMANSQPHDLYFHADPAQMLDGVVEPPGAFLGATEMLKRQLSAWCMDGWARDDGEASPIPRKASDVLGKGNERFPGRFLDWLEPRREALLAGFLEVFGPYLRPDGRPELEAWVRSDSGLPAAFHDAFAEVGDQITAYRRERERARKRLKQVTDDPTSVGDAEQEKHELKRFIQVLNQLMTELRETYPLNVLTDASVLPNYAFPESGVHLHSLLGSPGDEKEDGTREKRRYQKRGYVRPAARALRELAPFNVFYAEGHRVQVRQLEIGPKGSRIAHWRFCPSCHYRRRAVDPSKPADEGSCPRCGEPRWSDKGQVRPLLPMSTVRSVSDLVRSTTSDDTEERQQERYQIHQLFDVHPHDNAGNAVLVGELGFGFEYLSRVTLTEVNLGLQAVAEQGPKVRVGGEAASVAGFPTCRECGTVADPRDPRDSERAHAPFCPLRTSDAKPREPLYLYREVRSEALRFLLPFSEMHVERKLRSFQAAIAYGLRLRFRGRPLHLQVATMSEPRTDDREARMHFLVLFDVVPGGTGYLREYQDREQVFSLLAETLRGLERCACRRRGLDGCYLCLFAHQQQRWLPVLSSNEAQELLRDVLANRENVQIVANLSGVSMDGTVESELEERFVVALEERFGAEQHGKGCWRFQAGQTHWEVLNQVDLKPEIGLNARADFVFTAVAGPGLDERVVVETDGLAYHVMPEAETGRIGDDVRKRVALAGTAGWRIFSLTWADLKSTDQPVATLPAPLSASGKVWSGVFERLGDRIPEAARRTLGALPTLTPLELLWAYLEHPGHHWSDAVAALAGASLVSANGRSALTDDAGLHRVVPRLRSEVDPFPLPPLKLGKARPTDTLTAVEQAGDHALLLSVRPADLRALDPERVTAVLRLDDRHARRADPAFAVSWRRFLHGWNVLQFLPDAEAVTSEGLAVDDGLDLVVAEAEEDWVASLLAAGDGDDEAAADGFPDQLEAALEECLTDEARGLARDAWRQRLPLPDPNPIPLPGGLPTELSWASRRVAVCEAAAVEAEDLSPARAAGWEVLLLPASLPQLARALGRRAQDTTQEAG